MPAREPWRKLDFELAPHQRRCAELIAQGKSFILRSPTGSGKSEAIWLPFLTYRGESVPGRMIHVLPMRALANQLKERATKLNSDPRLRIAAMHGQRPESVLFCADIIFATLDQVVTSYACAPLTLGVRHGNIPAGAIAGSFLVFDEVHTFEPALGLQSTLVIAERAARLGIPFVIMSATLPTSFAEVLRDRLGLPSLEVVDGDRLPPAKGGLPRRVKLDVHTQRLDHENLGGITALLERANKALVVVNTVDRAIRLYDALRAYFGAHRCVLLAHSRFYDEDRARKEEAITALFSRDANNGPAILVATQVVEVGLDISCDTLLTELAPVDSLIQRAGRCARWGGNGEVHVFADTESPAPYALQLIDRTRDALADARQSPRELDWALEKRLVDSVLGAEFEKWAQPEAAGRALSLLAEAAFTGDRKAAQSAVRDSLDLEVAIHDKPHELGKAVLRLPRCKLHPGVFANFVRDSNPRTWRVEIDASPRDDYEANIDLIRFLPKDRIVAGRLYIVHPDFACYDPDCGLRLGRPGQPAATRVVGVKRVDLPDRLKCETWAEHADNIVRKFDEVILPEERFALRALARYLEIGEDILHTVIRLVLIFHDLGKLTVGWQSKIRQGLDDPRLACSFLAHRGAGIRGLPPHAAISAWVASSCISRKLTASNPRLRNLVAEPAIAAIAHHHSVRAASAPMFRMIDGWFEPVHSAVVAHTQLDVSEADFYTEPPSGSGRAVSAVNLLSPGYCSYVFLSRWLRLSDRIATGGEHAIYDYEKWFGDL